MNTEELQKQIENLPEKDKQTIRKIKKMDDSELENAVGGLSNKAKAILIGFGAASLGTGVYVAGYKTGKKAGHDETVRNYIKNMETRKNLT